MNAITYVALLTMSFGAGYIMQWLLDGCRGWPAVTPRTHESTELAVLAAIATGANNISPLGRRLGMSTSTVAYTLAYLEGAGHIESGREEQTGRRNYRLTDPGWKRIGFDTLYGHLNDARQLVTHQRDRMKATAAELLELRNAVARFTAAQETQPGVGGQCLAHTCDCPCEEEKPGDWFFTFGAGHPHPVLGGDLYGSYVVIESATFGAARAEMIARFGARWAYQYESAHDAEVDEQGLRQLVGVAALGRLAVDVTQELVLASADETAVLPAIEATVPGGAA